MDATSRNTQSTRFAQMCTTIFDPQILMKQAAQLKQESTAAKAGDVLFQHAHKIENLSKEHAFELVDELLAEGGISDFKLGAALAVIHDKTKTQGNEDWLEGHQDFRDLCLKRFHFRYRKAMYLIGIYKHLVAEQIPWGAVKDLPWSKLRVLASKKAIDSKQAITMKNLEKCVKRAKELTVEELEGTLKKKGGGKSKKATKTFPIFEDQEETIDLAIDKIKKEVNTDHDGVALHQMAQRILGNAVTMEAVEEEKPKPKAQLKEYWVKRLAEQFKEITEDLGQSDEGGPGVILEVFGTEYPKITVDVTFPA